MGSTRPSHHVEVTTLREGSHVSVELRTSISEIFSISIINPDNGDGEITEMLVF
jgi:hypothetical protein